MIDVIRNIERSNIKMMTYDHGLKVDRRLQDKIDEF